ncbi:hypothetical protein PSAC2689_290011 [Paraburkholderia sacchari]
MTKVYENCNSKRAADRLRQAVALRDKRPLAIDGQRRVDLRSGSVRAWQPSQMQSPLIPSRQMI